LAKGGKAAFCGVRSPPEREREVVSYKGGLHMANELSGQRIAFLATDMVEQVELTGPWEALQKAGATLELISDKDGEIQGFNHYHKAGTFKVDKTVEEADAGDYDALVLPGGVGNPDTLRMDENAVRFVRDFF
jgi:protease I